MRKRTSRIILLFSTAALLLMTAMPSFGTTYRQPPATSRDGLQVIKFSCNIQGTSPLQAHKSHAYCSFILKNVTDHQIKFDPRYGIFFGCRQDNVNRDFGHRKDITSLAPGEKVRIKANISFDAPGTWRIWPAYNANGHWGPYRWNEIVISVEPCTGRGCGGHPQ